MFAIVG